MVHFQTDVLKSFKKYPWRRLRRRPQGAAAPWGGVFFKICLKMERIFKHLFENGPYLGHPIFKLAIRLVFQSFTV